MIHRRSCKKCVEYSSELTKKDVMENGPPFACCQCRRFYPDMFIPRGSE